MNSEAGGSEKQLNENQQRHLRVSCEYVDKLLSEVEGILNSSTSKAAFPRYVSQISPVSRRTIEDYISRIRAQLLRILDGQSIPREKPTIPDVRAIYVTLGAIDIALDELKPRNMRGYGDVPEKVALDLNGIVGELQGLILRLTRYVLQGEGQDLRARLQRLEETSGEFELLNTLEHIVAARGLVEFRPSIAAILDRMEDKSFEIAVFGRVSSGKSSLLNRIFGADILPVGVTPITAVPTRIKFGERPLLTVWFAERSPQTFEVSRLPEFVTEQQNHGNAKNVTRLVLQFPAQRLRDGVTFVDTPGLGSLATSGAAETLAYLPRCDLGVVLIDGGATLTPDDLHTIETLQEAAISVHLLLSKADLLAPSDRERILAYVKEHVTSECRLDLPVHPVSALAGHRMLLDHWFEEEILPLYAQAQELKAASLRRKIGALRESVVAALRVRLQRSQAERPPDETQFREAEDRLRQATGKIEELRTDLDREFDKLPLESPQILEEVAVQLFRSVPASLSKETSTSQTVRAIASKSVQDRTRVFHERVTSLAHLAAAELIAVAKMLSLTNTPLEDEFDSLVRGVPVFELEEFRLEVSRSRISLVIGAGFAKHSLIRQLNNQVGLLLDRALATYAGLLRSWAMSALKQLKHGFDAYADGYRAQVERVLRAAAPGAGEIEVIVGDLQLLGANAEPMGERVTAVATNQ